jgi:hypothetical protein
MLPLLQVAAQIPTPSDNATAALTGGATTLDFAVTGLPADPSASALGLALTATFGDAASHFGAAYVANGTFVSGAGDAPIALGVPLVVDGAMIVLPLSIHAPVVTFTATANADAITGTIAGTLDVGELQAVVSAFATTVDPSYFAANMQALLGLAAQVAQAADILLDGTNASGVSCTALSIGLGFTAHRVAH